jgi:hypothetical protein
MLKQKKVIMKKLFTASLITGISATSSLLYIVNPAFAASPQTITPENKLALFPTHAFLAKTRLCAKTLDGQTGKLYLRAGVGEETIQVTSRETCIERQWGGVRVKVYLDTSGNSRSITVFTS